jgi:hypothetical protein
VPVVAAAAPALIRLAQEGRQVRRLVAAALLRLGSCAVQQWIARCPCHGQPAAAAAPALIKLVQEGRQVGSLVGSSTIEYG